MLPDPYQLSMTPINSPLSALQTHMKYAVSLFVLAAVLITAAGAASPDVAALLAQPIIEHKLPVAEVQAYAEPLVPRMPEVKTVAEWERIATQLRRDVLEKIVFRGEAARQWRDAATKVEWLETIEGGPGYHIKKVRYEALPGLWIAAVFYEPDQRGPKIPVHLALNGHEGTGKATPYIQLRCINLAKRGIATLNPEWFSMGQQNVDFHHSRLNQLDLCGASGLAPFYLAMSRGLDLLLALPYADAKRVAVSGMSGGGWQTIMISSLDPRVTLCNPVAGYSSFRTRARFPTDLGDSEQQPSDLATVADYTHLTAMLAGRAALLTYNAKDNCCFASDHALAPLVEAAAPMFALYGQGHRLRTHVNYDPGTHNYELDNRQAFYRVIGEEFFPGDASYQAQEIPSEGEVKPAAALQVTMPNKNLGFHALALQLSADLPRQPDLAASSPEAARARLAELVKFKTHEVVAQSVRSEKRGEVQAAFWRLRVGNTWTVPAVELIQGEPKGTTVLVADKGRKSAAVEVEALLAAGQRVIALDPLLLGESQFSPYSAYLLAAVGDRPLGIQASEMAATARWAGERFKNGPLTLQTIGPRSSTLGLIATALERQAIGQLKMVQNWKSLHQMLEENWTGDQMPELFCFGLFEAFDLPQIEALVGAERLR